VRKVAVAGHRGDGHWEWSRQPPPEDSRAEAEAGLRDNGQATWSDQAGAPLESTASAPLLFEDPVNYDAGFAWEC